MDLRARRRVGRGEICWLYGLVRPVGFRNGTDVVSYGLAQTLGFRTGTHTLALRPGTPAARVYQVSEEWPYGPGVGWGREGGGGGVA